MLFYTTLRTAQQITQTLIKVGISNYDFQVRNRDFKDSLGCFLDHVNCIKLFVLNKYYCW